MLSLGHSRPVRRSSRPCGRSSRSPPSSCAAPAPSVRANHHGGPLPDLPADRRLRHVRGLPAGRADEPAARAGAAAGAGPAVQHDQRGRTDDPAQRDRVVAGHAVRPHGVDRAAEPRVARPAAHLRVGRVRQQAAVAVAGGAAHVRCQDHLRQRLERAGLHEDQRRRRQRRVAVRPQRRVVCERRLEKGVCRISCEIRPILQRIQRDRHPPGLHQRARHHHILRLDALHRPASRRVHPHPARHAQIPQPVQQRRHHVLRGGRVVAPGGDAGGAGRRRRRALRRHGAQLHVAAQRRPRHAARRVADRGGRPAGRVDGRVVRLGRRGRGVDVGQPRLPGRGQRQRVGLPVLDRRAGGEHEQPYGAYWQRSGRAE
ncbi:hypothetical protein VTK26DRAFT_4002 [Humicola hyalothermophila]